MIALFLLTVLCFLYVPTLAEPFLLPKEILFQVVCTAALFWHFFFKEDLSVRKGNFIASVFLICGFVLSSAFSTTPWASFHLGITFLLFPFVFDWLHQLFQKAPHLQKHFSEFLVSLSVLQILIGLWQMMNLYQLRGWSGLQSERFFAGTLGNSEYLAYFLGASLLFTRDSKIKRKPFWVSLILLGLLLARSKAAILALFLALIARTSWTIAQKFWTGTALTITAIALGLAGYASGLKGRLLLDLIALRDILKQPVTGFGSGHFQYTILDSLAELLKPNSTFYFLREHAAVAERVHNEWLDIWVEGGLLTLIGFAIFLFSYLRNSAFGSKQSQGLLIFIFVMSLVSFPFHVAPNLLLTLLILAAISNGPKDNAAEDTLIKVPTTALAMVFAGLLIPILYFGGKSLLGSSYVLKAKEALNENLFEKALSLSKTSLLYSPTNPEAGHLQAFALEKLNAPAQAGAFMNEVLNAGLMTYDLKKERAYVLFQTGEVQKSFEEFQFLASAFPAQVSPQFMMGFIQLRRGRTDEAQVYFQKCLQFKAKSLKAQAEQNAAKWFLSQPLQR